MTNAIRRGMSVSATAALLLLAGCELYEVDGNGERASETRPLQGFSAVQADGSLDVRIVRGDAFRVEVSIDSNLLDRVHTGVSGETLWIDDERIGDTVAGPHVIVTMPLLRGATLNGSGGVSATGFQQDQPVSLVLDGSGQIDFAGEVARADVRLAGSGDVHLRGTAPALNVRLDGSGSVDARDLNATTADLSLEGSGNLAASVSDSVRVSLSGSGDVDLYGGANLQQVSISGSGSVRRH